jgi:hypothetical protein
MCKLFGWRRSPVKKEDGCREIDESDRRFRVAREAFNDAIAKQFNSIYGTDLEDISSWKNLCRALGIIPIPKGLQECRDVSNLVVCSKRVEYDGFKLYRR